MPNNIPHFAVPFRFSGRHVETVQQDSIDDIAGCVEVIMRTPIGARSERPNFGIPDLAFRNFQKGIVGPDIEAMIVNLDPRIHVEFAESFDAFDSLIARVTANVYQQEEGK